MRRWQSVGAFVQEVSDARVYEGVHYRYSTEEGVAMGTRIGALAAVKFLGPSSLAAVPADTGEPRATSGRPAIDSSRGRLNTPVVLFAQ